MLEWHSVAACPDCGGRLRIDEKTIHCVSGDHHFPMVDGMPRLTPGGFRTDQLLETPDGVSMAAGYRAPNRLLHTLRRIITSEYFPGKTWRLAKAEVVAGEAPLLIIGSGVTRYPNAIHLDIDDFPGVDVVGDAHQLPFADNSFNGVVCEVVLEHVHNPAAVIAQAHRVLKPGGRCFFIVPFLFPYHGHPDDYRRWSKQGLRQDFSAFEALETGIHGGPCSAMINLITEWGYVLSGQTFPKGYTLIKGGLTTLLFPLKFLDFFVNRFPEAHRLASTLYITGQKAPAAAGSRD